MDENPFEVIAARVKQGLPPGHQYTRSEPEYKCNRCRDLKWLRHDVPFGHPDFGNAIPCPDCTIDNTKERLLEFSGVPSARLDQTFESFNLANAKGMTESYNAALEFATTMPYRWLMLSSSTKGCGKTHLAYAICQRFIERGISARICVVADLLADIRATFKPDSTVTADEIYKSATVYPTVLVLDDLGAEKSSPWVLQELFRIFDDRNRHKKPLVITTNVDPRNFDERISSRLSDVALCRVVVSSSPDYRHRKR